MASEALASTALLLSLNILFFTMVSSTYVPCSPPPKTPSTSPPPKAPSTSPPPKEPSTSPPPKAPSTSPPPKAPSTSVSSAANTCPKDTLKIGACVNVLNGDLVNLVLGKPPSSPDCCPLIQGLADLEAAVCLCTTIKLNVLNIVNLNVPIDLSLILNNCGKKVPSGFECA